MAPCPKVSSSSSLGVSWRMRRISSRLSSRARTTRLAPRSYQARAQTLLAMDCWVEMCRSQWGAYRPASMKAPRSARINASTPAASSSSRYPGSRGTSSPRGMVFTVTWTRTPRSWARATARGSSSGVKFPAKERIPKLVPAKYTASAPYSTAMVSRSISPAGARSSRLLGLFVIVSSIS